ncbi:MAG: glycosyltransferase family 4 protein [Candidatus Sulfotelmatobacter sp.]
MRILYCNKYNYPFSGTEAYMFAAMDLMRSKGHSVALFSMADGRGESTPYDHHFMPHAEFKNQEGWSHKVRLVARAIYSLEARRRIGAMIADFRPDVAHVRNIYHHLSPSILWELKRRGIPVVYHLNDFKVLCPSYNLVSRGEACEACKGGKSWHLLKEKCYPGWPARMTLMAEAYFHRSLGTYRKCVDCFLAPSQFVRDKFVEHGWDAAKFEVLPHFQPVCQVRERDAGNAPILYFGRLSSEKGVADLLRAMQRLPNIQLVIAGDGPERIALEQMRAQLELENVKFIGQIGGEELESAIAGSRFTVLPSHAYETLGKTILESYAHGRAVIASDLGSRRELVYEGKTGLLYETGDVSQLASALKFLSSQPGLADEMGLAGRELVRLRHTPGAHYESLVGLYERLAEEKGRPARVATASINEISKPAKFPQRSAVIRPTGGSGFIPVQRLSLAPLLNRKEASTPMAVQKPVLRVAFIGGRGVISKYSGIEAYYEEVGKRLAGMGHEVTAYCRTYFTPAVQKHNGIAVVRLPTIRSKHLETLVHTFVSTVHVMLQPCDIVHYHALGPALFSFIPRLVGKKTVVTVQGLDWQRKKWGRFASAVLRLGERAAVSLPSGTIVVSRTLRQHYWKNHGVETSYVPNGGLLRDRRIPDKLLDWGLEANRYILFLGRFSPEKGCHLLVEAYEQLDTDVKLVMAGASSYCDDYSQRLRAHVSERIKMLDWVSGAGLDELLTNAMLFVLPSDLEGLSLALLDAMGAGLCVLASDVPENREAIEDAGFTFRRGDVSDLADRLRFLLANPSVREAAGEAAKRRIREQYRWTNVAAETERVYFETMGWEWSEPAAKKPSVGVARPVPGSRRIAG